jgi:hypothetical protein
MYMLAPGIKGNAARQWALPDRVFFASGACHILAYAFLDSYPSSGFTPIWIKPARGCAGNHIVVVRDGIAFDYHGYSDWQRLLAHTHAKASRWWPGWSADLLPLAKEVLISEAGSRRIDGLWLREPGQYLHDAIPRARRFLARFPHPPASVPDTMQRISG